MQFLNSLFADNRWLTLGAAVAAFLVFAVLVLLIVRLLFGNRLRIGSGRGRQQRLGVVDAFDMDRQRQLVLVRRDNTEHLILIGGPNDLLIESAIVRAEGRDAREGRDRAAPTVREGVVAEPPRIAITETRPAVPEPTTASTSTTVSPTVPSLPAATAIQAPVLPATTTAPVSPPVRPVIPAQTVTPPVSTTVPAAETAATSAPPVSDTPDTVPASSTPVPPPVKEGSRLPDLFARIRSSRAPKAEPIVSAPGKTEPSPSPPDDTNFFEEEIAKALAPSIRNRPAPSSTPPVVPASIPTEEPPATDVTSGPAPVFPPARTPFQPFATRRDGSSPTTAAEPRSTGGANSIATPARSPSVRPPPPFFSRSPPAARERIEPTVATDTVVAEGDAETPKPVLQPNAAETPKPVLQSNASVVVPQPVRETTTSSPPTQPPPKDAGDPFEEEMARLLGRSSTKE